jgi:uncharacterized membrane protein
MTVTNLGVLSGGFNSAANAVSTQGIIVGESETSTHNTVGVYWPANAITPTALPGLAPGLNSAANALTNAASPQITGTAETATGNSVAVLWSPAPGGGYTIQNLGTLLLGMNSYAYGINNAASPQIVGASEISASSTLKAFVWQSGSMTALPSLGLIDDRDHIAISINLAGEIVGFAETSSGSIHAVRWTPTGLLGAYVINDDGVLPGGMNSKAYDINNTSDSVGVSENGTGAVQAFINQGGTKVALAALAAGSNSTAQALINAGGTLNIVGTAETSTGTSHAVAWKAVAAGGYTAPIDLGTLSGGFNSSANDVQSVGGVAVAVGQSETNTGTVCAVKYTAF